MRRPYGKAAGREIEVPRPAASGIVYAGMDALLGIQKIACIGGKFGR